MSSGGPRAASLQDITVGGESPTIELFCSTGSPTAGSTSSSPAAVVPTRVPILITGVAGFIGFHLALKCLEAGIDVVGFDCVNDYYDVTLKASRIEVLTAKSLNITVPTVRENNGAGASVHPEAPGRFSFVRANLESATALQQVFDDFGGFDVVVHLAAQAGVRYSITNPGAYVQSNLVGFGNVLECCRRGGRVASSVATATAQPLSGSGSDMPRTSSNVAAVKPGVKHLVYASSSSVYGTNTKVPFSESDCVDHPVSLYAATKKSNELMAHSYALLFGLPSTGLRFFTVYGPWGRPDMAIASFSEKMILQQQRAGSAEEVEKAAIEVFNHGQMSRDFTYIDDIVEGILRVMVRPPVDRRVAPSTAALPTPAVDASVPLENEDPAGSRTAPYRVFNIGKGAPQALGRMIEILEQEIGRDSIGMKAKHPFVAAKIYKSMQPGDVVTTYADTSRLETAVGFIPRTTLEVGLQRYVEWYRLYYQHPAPAAALNQ